MALQIIQDWKGYSAFSREQHHTVGLVAEAPDGTRASYVELPGGDYTAGTVVSDRSAVTGTVGAGNLNNSGEGERTLEIGSQSFPNNDLVGAIGIIRAGTGKNQVFVVEDHPTEGDTEGNLQIARWNVLSQGYPRQKGWETGLAADSAYAIRLPGRVEVPATAVNNVTLVRGVLQTDVEVPAGTFMYGWVLQQGIGFGVGASATIAEGEVVVMDDGGKVGDTTTDALLRIGRALFTGGVADDLVVADFNIVNNAVSARKSNRAYAFSRVDI